ncbi:hypothetical protein, variant [Blastomyces gilchristii SLH14081]|uniref:Uncharacterized protein n=2 Tax=Blastomyces TaxID=229219 RepID=A0A179UV15_BLAGS|nr:hypothetical protein, variant [Blastomyces gilchristii SLH14081]OAT10998.1 hypothetical protein, variant [Blastomyces gilchristii SLH14081]
MNETFGSQLLSAADHRLQRPFSHLLYHAPFRSPIISSPNNMKIDVAFTLALVLAATGITAAQRSRVELCRVGYQCRADIDCQADPECQAKAEVRTDIP